MATPPYHATRELEELRAPWYEHAGWPLFHIGIFACVAIAVAVWFAEPVRWYSIAGIVIAPASGTLACAIASWPLKKINAYASPVGHRARSVLAVTVWAALAGALYEAFASDALANAVVLDVWCAVLFASLLYWPLLVAVLGIIAMFGRNLGYLKEAPEIMAPNRYPRGAGPD